MAKGLVKFSEDRCKGCELCVSVCPVKIIHIHEIEINDQGYHPAGIRDDDMARCIACASCALMCPDGAVAVYREEGGRGR